MAPDKRKRSRVDASFEVVVSCGGLEKYCVRVRNLSLKGMLCDTDLRISGLTECTVSIALSEAISFTIDARMVRNDSRGLALDFVGMDENAFFHLRNIVRYHAPDPDAIDRELSIPAFDAKL